MLADQHHRAWRVARNPIDSMSERKTPEWREVVHGQHNQFDLVLLGRSQDLVEWRPHPNERTDGMVMIEPSVFAEGMQTFLGRIHQS